MSQKAATTAALMGPGDHCQKWDTGLPNTYLIPHVTSSVSKTEKKIIHSFGFSFTSECEILSTLPQGTNSGESCCHQLFVNREESFLLDKSTKIRKCMKIHWKSWDLVGNWSQICSSLAVKCLYFQHRAQMLDILWSDFQVFCVFHQILPLMLDRSSQAVLLFWFLFWFDYKSDFKMRRGKGEIAVLPCEWV